MLFADSFFKQETSVKVNESDSPPEHHNTDQGNCTLLTGIFLLITGISIFYSW